LLGLHARDAQAAETNDACAQEGSSLQRVESCGKGKDEIGASQSVFSVSAVDCVAGECRRVAEILHIVLAIPAAAIDAAHPGNTDAGSDWEIGCSAIHDLAHDLMTGN
jgi:hypothetical protein